MLAKLTKIATMGATGDMQEHHVTDGNVKSIESVTLEPANASTMPVGSWVQWMISDTGVISGSYGVGGFCHSTTCSATQLSSFYAEVDQGVVFEGTSTEVVGSYADMID